MAALGLFLGLIVYVADKRVMAYLVFRLKTGPAIALDARSLVLGA